jgi:hypothetical protein
MITYEFQKATVNGKKGWIATKRVNGVFSGRAFGSTKNSAIVAFE